jgi:hypothetical protein
MADWYPDSRAEQLHMIKTWNTVFAVKGLSWGIPQERMTELADEAQASESILDKVKSGERTPASVVQCKRIFGDMENSARFIKKHYLLVPPLLPEDLASLLLSQEDETLTPDGPPQGQPYLVVTYPGGPHLLAVHLVPLAGAGRGDYGIALYLGIMPQGGATLEQAAGIKHYLMKIPASGAGMLHHCFTRRKKELVNFDSEESGMTAYFCARYENRKGWWGPWGPVSGAVIP